MSVLEDVTVVAALRDGDQAAFASLVERYHASMVRVAHALVQNWSVAEEVTQDTWVAVLEGIDRFEGRSSLKTWLFRILLNKARTRAVREHRSIPFAALAGEPEEPAVDPGRFLGDDHPRWPGHWAEPPTPWVDIVADQVAARAAVAVVAEELGRLPAHQRVVVVLRDIHGLSADEVCELLAVSAGNQRVLLHRGRSRLRAALERSGTMAVSNA